MKKIELLAPAGDMESLKAAVLYGADAVYLSGKMYGARKFAKNFTLDEIESACRFCHLYGVFVYVTVNTLVLDSLVDDFMKYVEQLYKIGVDALIMQDLGMIDLVHRTFPNLEIHASTQCDNHNNEKLELLKDLGVKRAVLARELSINEIANLNCDIDKEVFIHGSLCVSYSGLCLFSSAILGRSGNQGACAGMCRLPYQLYENNKKVLLDGDYLFSMKDLCSFDYISSLIDLGITSLKIEGRMKSSFYVGFVTYLYRNMIDAYYDKRDFVVTKEMIKDLQKLYYRGFTNGFLGDSTDLISLDTPNHKGVVVGKVLDCSHKIKILLSDDLSQGDGIRFGNDAGMIVNYLYNKDGLLVSSLRAGEIAYVDNKGLKLDGCFCYKTSDIKLIERIGKWPKREIPITFTVRALLGEKLLISISDGVNSFSEHGSVVTKALKRIVTKEDVVEKLSKLGDTPFVIKDIFYTSDDEIFIPISDINNIRRLLTSKLIDARSNKKIDFVKKDVLLENDSYLKSSGYVVSVNTEEQLKECLNYPVDIYTKEYNLYLKYKDVGVGYKTERIEFNYRNGDYSSLLISDLGALHFYNTKMFSDVYLNVTNSYTVRLLRKLGVSLVGLSPELSYEEVKKLVGVYERNYKCDAPVMTLVYGKLELMIMKYCPINYFVSSTGSVCNLCLKNNYKIKDRNGKYYSFLKNRNSTSLLHYDSEKHFDYIDKIPGSYYLAFTNESGKEVQNILKNVVFK